MPKVFVSYSWTSDEHQRWVLDLATALRENGVDVILDKWDLREGHDAIAFMERMVTDESVEKVIIVLDRRYSEKANDRKGGVGTETQIITPQIYEKADQDKFVGVVSEVDADGKPFKPAYYASRIHIDLSNEDIYAENFDHLLRWIFNKPAYPKPAVGKPPEFLKEDAVVLPTRSYAQRAISLVRSASPAALGALVEYFDNLSESLEMLRIEFSNDAQFEEDVLKSISAFQPYRDEFIGVLAAISKGGLFSEEYVAALKRFFEHLIPFMYKPPKLMSYSDHWFDNYKFIIHELFLYAIATLVKQERFSEVDQFLSGGFFSGAVADGFAQEPLQEFPIFRHHVRSLAARNERLNLRRISLHADLLKDRAPRRLRRANASRFDLIHSSSRADL